MKNRNEKNVNRMLSKLKSTHENSKSDAILRKYYRRMMTNSGVKNDVS